MVTYNELEVVEDGHRAGRGVDEAEGRAALDEEPRRRLRRRVALLRVVRVVVLLGEVEGHGGAGHVVADVAGERVNLDVQTVAVAD